MKKIIPLLAVSLVIFLTSCEQETQLEVNESSDFTTSINAQKNPAFTPDPCCGEENLFERQLHWFSYLAAEVVISTPAARAEMKSLLSANGGVYLPARLLIGDTNQAPIFNAVFHDRLIWYYDDWTGWPNSTQTNPPWPPGSGGITGDNTGNFMADLYYSVLLDLNCVELYYPSGLDFKITYPSVSSTAHPLTTSGANEGIEFNYSPLISEYYSSDVVVNNAYSNPDDNLIVARPRRTTIPIPGSNCAYQEYNGIIFTDFLD